MKENDIMLGDWLRRRWTCTDTGREVVKDFQVTEIHKLGNFLYAWGKNGNMGRVEQLEPIPLTAEILEKNGFTRFGTDYILKERHFGLENPSIPSNYLDNYWLRVSIKAVHIEYIHQLQHALRLCGIDLDIVI